MVSWGFGCLIFCLLTNSELALRPVGKPPPPKEEEEEEKEAPGSSQEPGDRDGGGGAQPTLLAQVSHPCHGVCSPAHSRPAQEPGRPGMVTLT